MAAYVHRLSACVVEAGTVTVKTLGLPDCRHSVAKALEQNPGLISTLPRLRCKNQIVLKDLPDLKKPQQVDINWGPWPKGRGAICCLSRLEVACTDEGNERTVTPCRCFFAGCHR